MWDFNALLTKPKTIAVVGASDDANKYGYRVYKFLKERGYEVYPVNPKRATIQGDKAYATLADLPVKVDIVDVVTPPAVSAEIYAQAQQLGLPVVWFQPGAEFAKQSDEAAVPQMIVDHCIMVEIAKL